MSELGVACVHELCPICLSKMNEHIIMNMELSESRAKKVEEMHNKPIDFSHKPCDECQKLVDDGFLALISIDPEKSNAKDGHVKLYDIYRTGSFYWLNKEKALHLLEVESYNLPFMLLDQETYDKLVNFVQERIKENEEEIQK